MPIPRCADDDDDVKSLKSKILFMLLFIISNSQIVLFIIPLILSSSQQDLCPLSKDMCIHDIVHFRFTCIHFLSHHRFKVFARSLGRWAFKSIRYNRRLFSILSHVQTTSTLSLECTLWVVLWILDVYKRQV